MRFRVFGSSWCLLMACSAFTACKGPAPAEVKAVASAAALDETPSPTRVVITAQGFEPARVFIEASHPLVFRRTTNESCATALVFPEFGIERALPLNTDVSVPLPATAEGELAFQCGVGKQRGKLFARFAG